MHFDRKYTLKNNHIHSKQSLNDIIEGIKTRASVYLIL